jgi:hypothetical protein
VLLETGYVSECSAFLTLGSRLYIVVIEELLRVLTHWALLAFVLLFALLTFYLDML